MRDNHAKIGVDVETFKEVRYRIEDEMVKLLSYSCMF